MKRFALILSLSLLFSFSSLGADDREQELLKGFHNISSNTLLGYAQKLTSPEFGGRLTGTPEYRLTAQWVADRLKEWGIRPGGEGGTYFQEFPAPYTSVDSAGSVVFLVKDGSGALKERPLLFPDEYFPGSNSASGKVEGEVVYVGFGITAPELKYDDYRGITAKGKIVLVESGSPYEKNDPPGAAWAPYNGTRHKLENALRHGAAGLLVLDKVGNPNTLYQPGFVYAHTTHELARQLLLPTGKDIQVLKEEIVKTLKPRSFSTSLKARITASTTRHPEGKGCNVVGLLEGSDPELKEEVLILGGHLDHLGTIGTLFPGALDNASGCVDILGAAQALGTSPLPRKRSLLFLFFGGEESGLLGSTYYTQHPLFPLQKTKIFMNLDMVGNGTGLSLWGGLSYPKIEEIFRNANDRYIHRPWRASQNRPSYGRPRSDGAVFSRAGFPTIGVGATDTVKPIYYHDPRDTWQELTPEIMEDVSRLLFLGLTEAANADL